MVTKQRLAYLSLSLTDGDLATSALSWDPLPTKALIVVGIVVNLFGALTFDREWKYYRVGGNAYDVVVPN